MSILEQRSSITRVADQPVRIVLLAVWFGLMTGLGELSLRFIQKFVLHKMIFVTWHVVCIVLAGLILLVAAWSFPRFISWAVVYFLFSLLMFAGPCMNLPRIAVWAGMIFAVGLATLFTRFINAHQERFEAIVQRTMGWLVGLVVIGAVSVFGYQGYSEARAVNQLPTAKPDAPNVILITLDTVRAASLSLYGYEQPTTPRLDGLAKESLVFDRALTTAPWTLTSHASMFTGRYPHEMTADWKVPFDEKYPTLAEVLSTKGYLTAGFIANYYYCTYEWGLNRGFNHYEDFPVSVQMIVHSSLIVRDMVYKARHWLGYFQPLARKSAARISRDFLAWESSRGDRPFFAFLNYYDAHDPYIAPKQFELRFGTELPADPWWLDPGYDYVPEEVQALKDAYHSCIAYLDDEIGKLMDLLETRGLLDNTVIIITSDHGEEFIEHGVPVHGNSLYRASVQVPLLIHWPSKVTGGTRVQQPVTLRDLPATILGLIGLNESGIFPGQSLIPNHGANENGLEASASPLLSEVKPAANLPEWYPVSKGEMKSLVADGYRYILNGDGTEELYHFETDLWENNNLVNTQAGDETLDSMRATLK